VNATSLTFKVTDFTTPTAGTNTATLALTITNYSVALSWGASSSPSTSGYNIYRSTVRGSGYTKVNSTPISGLSFTDSTVVAGQTYYYVSTAVDSSGDEIGYSNQIQEVVPVLSG
jgi:fibronectin type 3 domain-containing protein